jgi:hypothetical protein
MQTTLIVTGVLIVTFYIFRVIVFKYGTEVNRFVGIKSKDFLLKEIAKVS